MMVSDNSPGRELAAEELRRSMDLAVLDFESTADLPELVNVIGQDRAVKAVSFGIDIESPGYHMFALGPAGTGKKTILRKFLRHKAATYPVPDDWCYVNNFADRDKPRALRLPAGMGCKFQADMERLVEELTAEVPSAFETEAYEKEREQIQQKFQEQRLDLFEKLEKEARESDFRLLQTQRGILLVPTVKGEVLSPEDFEKLGESQRRQIEQRQEQLQEQMRQTMRIIRQQQKEAKDNLRVLDREVIGYAVDHLITELREKYAEQAGVVEYLDAMRGDILENVTAFKQAKELEETAQSNPVLLGQLTERPNFDQYRINLIVDNCSLQGAPVILESNPTYANLVGRIEHQASFGALVTNFQMIKGGSLHAANGGYLMVDARDILSQPLAWEALKRALRDEQVKIETLSAVLGGISTRSLEPEPIPLDVKVVVVGEGSLYYLLYSRDEEFRELFKVKADFSDEMDWEPTKVQEYACFIGSICREEKLHHFDPSGVAQILEYSARMVSDQFKLATKFGEIVDLIRQSSYWAGVAGHAVVSGADVERALEEKIYRSNRLETRIQEMIRNGTILIDTQGQVVGQVNGISLIPLGDYSFGKPSRITARTYAGSKGVVNIDREINLGGRIHNKGVLILSGYLGGNFAQETPLDFSASLTFEQLYEEIDGDSAASAELYALLSSLSELPLRQDLAVTGSVNQLGQVQAIGGVNEKIEGYFAVCKIMGLTGDQGVIIPESNVRNLMLHQEVVQAVASGRFHIYPVAHIDEGIALLTGKSAGQRQSDGTFPEGTVNWAVDCHLNNLTKKELQSSPEEPAPGNGQTGTKEGDEPETD